MITDPRVFLEEHVPGRGDLLHRDQEREHLERALIPTTRGEPAHDVLISGPSGVGKTATTRYMLARLREQQHVPSARISCVSHDAGGILYQAISKHPRDVAVHHNTPLSRKVDILCETVTEPFVLVLDEADDVPNQEVMRHLTRIPYLSVVAITHDATDWMSRLDPPTRSRFQIPERIEFGRYAHDELVEILELRREQGLEPDIVTDDQLAEIADEAAGIARDAIQALRAAVDLAIERDHDRVEPGDLTDCFERARQTIRAAHLQSLSFQHHIVYELIRQSGEISGGDLETLFEKHAPDLYQTFGTEPVGTRMLRTYRQKLIEYDCLIKMGENRWATYRATDPTLAAPGELPSVISEKIGEQTLSQ